MFSFLKHKQEWHVSFIIFIEGKMPSYGDGVFSFSFKPNKDSITPLRQKLAEQTKEITGIDVKPEQINILSMTKLS